MDIERRDILKLGAGGALAAGALGALASAGPAGAQADAGQRLRGIHIHGSLKGGEPVVNGRVIDVTVYGPDDDLNGSGWDANPTQPGSKDPAAPDRSQCFFTQRGSVQGDVVKLSGRNLFWHNPGDDGAPITTEANLATGQIRWVIVEAAGHSGEGGTFVFEGTGVVGRI